MLQFYTSPTEDHDMASERIKADLTRQLSKLAIPPPVLFTSQTREEVIKELFDARYGRIENIVKYSRGRAYVATPVANGMKIGIQHGTSTFIRLLAGERMLVIKSALYAVMGTQTYKLGSYGARTLCASLEEPIVESFIDEDYGCLIHKNTLELYNKDGTVLLLDSPILQEIDRRTATIRARDEQRYHESLVKMLEYQVPARVRAKRLEEQLRLLNNATAPEYVERPTAELRQARTEPEHPWFEHIVQIKVGCVAVLKTICERLLLVVNGEEQKLPYHLGRPNAVTFNDQVVSVCVNDVWYGFGLDCKPQTPRPYQLTSIGELIPMPALVTIDLSSDTGRAVTKGLTWVFTY
jgi:hypothetical protein